MNDKLPVEVLEFEQLLQQAEQRPLRFRQFFHRRRSLDRARAGAARRDGRHRRLFRRERLRSRARPRHADGAAAPHRPHAAHPHHAGRHPGAARGNAPAARRLQIRRRPGRLRRNPRVVPGKSAGKLGRLHRRQHFHAAQGGVGETALRLQSPAVERRADERRHRQFRRRGNRHALLPQRLSRLETRRRRASRGSARWRKTTSSARPAASWTRSPSPADARAVSRTSSAGPARSKARCPFPPAPASSASIRWCATPSPATPTATRASARSWARKSSTTSAPAPAAARWII